MTESGPDSWIKTVSMAPPSLQDNTADADRLMRALKSQLPGEDAVADIDFSVLVSLPEVLRRSNFELDCILFKDRNRWSLIGIQSTADEPAPAGLAVDLGTTRVVLRLLDLKTDAVIAETSFTNPQTEVGPDILTRLHYAGQPDGLGHLNALIRDGLNHHIQQLCRSGNRSPADVYLVSLAGNSAMTHLFLGLPPYWMIREPYIPVVNRPGVLRAAALGLQLNPAARLFVFPNIGSYFGGDLLAGILFSGMHLEKNASMLVDVGTNAEVVLGNRDWLIACAGAAGPALEGGVTQIGMTAAAGVIDKIALDRESHRFRFHTIGDLPPAGICGSGLIDLAAELFLSGWIDIRGKFRPRACGDRLVEQNGLPQLIVVDAAETADGRRLTISQAELDSLIRSKAAMYTILETITETVGIPLNALSTFNVAGTFGAFIRPASAIAIGMVPDLPTECFKVLGNSSLGGAMRVLTSPGAMDEVDRIRDRLTYLELNVNQDFMNRFSAAKFLPHTDAARFPSVLARRAV
jgi:uncharacterized 2Fe-2S/4Fe-4S cluster protein (DUF4445 family)